MNTSRIYVAGTRRPRHARRLMTSAIALACAAAMAVPAIAAPGGNGKGNGKGGNSSSTEPAGACWADGVNHIRADGLPTHEQLNLLVTDSSSTDAWAIGETWSGDFYTWVPTRTETTTYEIISVQKGNDGKVYDVYATCTLEP